MGHTYMYKFDALKKEWMRRLNALCVLVDYCIQCTVQTYYDKFTILEVLCLWFYGPICSYNGFLCLHVLLSDIYFLMIFLIYLFWELLEYLTEKVLSVLLFWFQVHVILAIKYSIFLSLGFTRWWREVSEIW